MQVRLDFETSKKVKAASANNCRSFAQEVQFALGRYYATESKPDAWKRPIHPGEMLREDFMGKQDVAKVAAKMGILSLTLHKVMDEQMGISPALAEKLGKYFKTTPDFWLNLQAQYETEVTKGKAVAK